MPYGVRNFFLYHNGIEPPLGTATAIATCDAVTTGWNGSICTNYTVTYDPNGATGSGPALAIYKPNATVTVSNEGSLTKVDHSFTGWKDQYSTLFTV